MTDLETAVASLPEGMHYDDTVGLWVDGIVARNAPEHVVLPRPGRRFSTVTLDHMAGNSVLGMHLARIEQGGTKCGHRHMDETMALIVSGRGYSEYRQDDDKDLQTIEWEAGDVIVIPCNAWHQHFNASESEYIRQLSFRNTRLLNRILQNAKVVYNLAGATYNQASRFPDRYNDEPDYFSLAETLPDGRIRTNFIKQVGDQPLPDPDPDHGEGVSLQGYVLGGQRTLDVAHVGIKAGGFVRPHRPLAEEGMHIIRGEGRTDIWEEHGPRASVTWKAGDVIAPPMGVWRQHSATTDVQYFVVRDNSVAQSFGVEGSTFFDFAVPPRWPALLDPQA